MREREELRQRKRKQSSRPAVNKEPVEACRLSPSRPETRRAAAWRRAAGADRQSIPLGSAALGARHAQPGGLAAAAGSLPVPVGGGAAAACGGHGETS